MECPRCKGRMKRMRTRDKGNMVYRQNECSKCGERAKTIELYLIEHRSEQNDCIRRAVEAESQVRQLELSLDTIRNAFSCLQDAVRPLKEAEDRTEPVSSWPGRYTKDYRTR